MVFLSLKFWRRSRKKNNKRHFLYQVSKRTVGGFKHHPLPGALPVWEIIKIPFPSLVIKPEWGMQCGLPLSSLKFNLPARPQQNSWGNAGGSQRAGKHRQEPYPGGEPTGGAQACRSCQSQRQRPSFIVSNQPLLLGETQEWEIPM